MQTGAHLMAFEQLDVENRRVFVRLDLDRDDDESLSAAALDGSLATIQELRARGARVILAGHREIEKGPQAASLWRSGSKIAEALQSEVQFPDEVYGDSIIKLIRDTRAGQVVLLENLGKDPREASKDSDFGRLLAELCDVYVGDAPKAMLSSLASTLITPKRIAPNLRGAGLRLRGHLDAVEQIRLRKDSRTTTAVYYGGHARGIADLAALAKLVERLRAHDELVIGDRLGLQFLYASDAQRGPSSELSRESLAHCRQILARVHEKRVSLTLPDDVFFRLPGTESRELAPATRLPEDAIVLELGPRTISSILARSDRDHVLWVGSIGFDSPSDASADVRAEPRPEDVTLAKSLGDRGRFTVVAGASPVAAWPADVERQDDVFHCRCDAFIRNRLAGAPIPGLNALMAPPSDSPSA